MQFIIDNYIGNYLDKQATIEIKNHIEEYEKNTGNLVDSICIYHDKATKYVYDNVKASGDMNIRAYSADWCIPKILQLYTGKEFKVLEGTEDLKEKFSQNNWDSFNKEQIIFDNNIMHLCTF